MAKPIQEQIFKSRLTITYRTNITGTLTQETLPFRLLVLGNFSGDLTHKAELLPELEERKVRSIKRGANIDHYINEILPTARIPESLPNLKSLVPGTISAELSVTIPNDQLKKDGPVVLRVKLGDGKFSSSAAENGQCDIQGRLFVHEGQVKMTITGGVPKVDEVTLKVAGLVRGDLPMSRAETTLTPVTAIAQGSVTIPADKVTIKEDEDANLASSSPAVTFKVTVKDVVLKAERTIPFDSLGSMTPDHIAWSVPEIRRLLTIKFLLHELQADLRNMPELRKALKDALPGMFDSKDERTNKLAPFKELQTWSGEQYPLLKIKQT